MIATISGWVCVISLFLMLALEPKQPKKDARFKTGYKNNARRPIKSEKTYIIIQVNIKITVIKGGNYEIWGCIIRV